MIVSPAPIKRLLLAALLASLLFRAGGAWAIGLLQAYDEALQNDPTYRSAVYENKAGQENRAIGLSSLLPNLSMSYATNRNLLDMTTITNQGSYSSQPNYNGMVATLSLRQPLFNLADIARYQQGIAQAKYSQAQFSVHQQEFVVRLVSAYTDALYAEDQVTLAKAQGDAFEEQMRVNEQMFQKGEGTTTDELEAQSKLALSQAQLIESNDNLETARRTLATIVGKDVTQLDHLSGTFQVQIMQPGSFEDWKDIALANNAELTAQRYAVEASLQEMKKNRSGHMPQMDLVASISKNNAGSIYTYNQDMTVRSIGVEVSMPLYAGGYVSAMTSQADANYQRAKADLDDKTNKVLIELHKQFSLVLSSSARVNALVKAVDSSRLLVQATRQSIKGGVRTNLDLLNAQQQYYMALRDLAQARYNYLLSYLRLRLTGGTLSGGDLQKIAGYFVPADWP